MNTPLKPLDRPEATSWSITDDILRRAQDGELFIPQFQRSFRWEAEDIRKLFDSIYRGYPIGNLLLWETQEVSTNRTAFGPVEFDANPKRAMVVIDGQQRIVSLIAVLLGESPKDKLFDLYFDLEAADFVHGSGRQNPPKTWLSLSDVADTMRFLEWLQARKLPPDLVASANALVRALRDYRVPVYIVRSKSEEQIREIFQRLNTAGKPLQATEIFNALHRGRARTSLSDIVEHLETFGFGRIEEKWVLKAVGAILGFDVTKNMDEALRGLPLSEVDKALEQTQRALARVIGFLRKDARILHVGLLPYRVPLVPLTKVFHLFPHASPTTRTGLAAWLWRGAVSRQHARSDAPTIRAMLRNITNNEKETLQNLLLAVPWPDGEPSEEYEDPDDIFAFPEQYSFFAANVKMVCAAMAGLKPKNLETGKAIDVAELLNEFGGNAFAPVLESRAQGANGLQNRILHPPTSKPISQLVLRASPKALSAHCISESARLSLQRGDVAEFFSDRYYHIRVRLLKAFLSNAIAGWCDLSADQDPE